jgi:hypothetical protein
VQPIEDESAHAGRRERNRGGGENGARTHP